MTSSILNGARLNGSFGSLNKCERMVDRSIDVLDMGKMTGSSISVNIKGSLSACQSRAIISLLVLIRKTYLGTRLESLPNPLLPGRLALSPF